MENEIQNPNTPQPNIQRPVSRPFAPQRVGYSSPRPLNRPVFTDIARPAAPSQPPATSLPPRSSDAINPLPLRAVEPTPATLGVQPAPSPAPAVAPPPAYNNPQPYPTPQPFQQPSPVAVNPTRPATHPAVDPSAYPSLQGMNLDSDIRPRPVNEYDRPLRNSAAKVKHKRWGRNTDQPLTKQAKIFGVSMIAASAISLVTWLSFTRLPGFGEPLYMIGLMIVAAELLTGMGVLMQIKVNKKIYLGAGSVLLLFSLIGSLSYFAALNRLNNLGKEETATFSKQITQYQQMALPQSEKTVIITALNSYMARVPSQIAKQKGNPFPLIEDFLIALIPIAFVYKTQERRDGVQPVPVGFNSMGS